MTNPSVNMRPDCSAERYAGTPLCPDDAARLVANICEITQQKLPQVPCSASELTRIFDMGVEVYEESIHTEYFEVAIQQFLRQKENLRPASYREYKSVLGRMLKLSPEMRTRSVRCLRTRDCLELMTRACTSAHTLDKARRLLHCFFNYALQCNWCRENPVRRLKIFRKDENMVSPLKLSEVARLLEAVAQPVHRACAAAVGLMLWAGVRPAEVCRLCWNDVDFEENTVRIIPRTSKTGGARLINVAPILRRWLLRFRGDSAGDALIAPRNWCSRWRAVRATAGLIDWQNDALRHTFASYHLRYFQNLSLLQMEMGHGNARLLFSRYLNMHGLSKKNAAAFWGFCEGERLSRRMVRFPGENGLPPADA